MLPSRHDRTAARILSTLGTVWAMLLSMIVWDPPTSQAAIDPPTPPAAYASVVDCLRNARSLGLPNEPWRSPRFAITCFASAWTTTRYADDGTPAVGDAPRTTQAVVTFGDGTPNRRGEPGHVIQADQGSVGAVYGLAFSSGTNPNAPGPAASPRLFAGAFTKRITRYGPGGPGAIYVLDLRTEGARLFVQVPNVVPGPTGAPGNPGDGTRATWPNMRPDWSPEMGGIHTFRLDVTSKAWVGKTGLGDIDLDPSERYLAAVNLNDRTIYTYDTWRPDPQNSQTVRQIPAAIAACPGGADNFRPFALAYQPDVVHGVPVQYVGYVCSAETSGQRNDLRAGVMRFDGRNSWANVLQFPLAPFDAQRQAMNGIYTYPWQPWSHDVNTDQPIVSDIEITEAGDMIIGLRDRTGDIGGTGAVDEFGVANGDMLIARWNGSGWTAPSPAPPETFDDQGADEPYIESLWGATAYVPGNADGTVGGQVVASAGYLYQGESGGAAWYDVHRGARTGTEMIYPTDSDSEAYFLQKSAGLGDIELLCSWRAIGNRVWLDSNGNGLQDAGEPSISGVRLRLYTAEGQDTGMTVTTGSLPNAAGETDANDTFRFYVPPFRAYQVRVDPTMYHPGQPLAGLRPTIANAGGDDALDSDADALGVVTVPAGMRGEVDLRWDIGFVRGANVRVEKSGPARIGITQNATYTVAWANEGPGIASGVVVQDTLPAGMTFVRATGTYVRSGQTITWHLGTVQPGASGSFTVVGVVSTRPSGSRELQNCATIAVTSPGDTPTDNRSCVTTTVLLPDLTIRKTGPPAAQAGPNFTYTLTFANRGTFAATNVQVTDTLPQGLVLVAATPAPTWQSGQTLTWNRSTVEVGESDTITVVVRGTTPFDPTTAVSQLVTNRACITTPDDPAAMRCSTAFTTLQRPELVVTKTGPPTALVGDRFTYTLTLTNRGTFAASDVSVHDTLPHGMTLEHTPDGCSFTPATRLLTCTVGTLAAHEDRRTITIPVRTDVTIAGVPVDDGRSVQVSNTANAVTSTPGDDPDSGNTSTTTTRITFPDPGVTIAITPEPFPVGSDGTVTVTYGNRGSGAARDVTLTTTISGTSIEHGALPTGCTRADATITCALGTLAPGETGTRVFPISLPASFAADNLTATTVIATTTPERAADVARDNTATTTVVVVRPNPLVTIDGPSAVAEANAGQGSYFLYRLNWNNLYRQRVDLTYRAADVVLRLELPTDVSFVRVQSGPEPSSLTGDASGQTVIWNLGTLAPGQGGQVVVVVRTTVPANASFTTWARISTTTPGDILTDNQDSVGTRIVPPPTTIPTGASTIRLAIHSDLDPRSEDANPTNAVMLADGATIAWPAGEVLDFTPRLTSFELDSPGFPYEYRGRIIAWSIQRYEVNGVTKDPILADSRSVQGCRAGARPHVAPTSLSGCSYAYVGASTTGLPLDQILPTTPVREDDMRTQAHAYWTQPPAPPMRHDVWLYTVDPVDTVRITVQVELEVWIVNAYPGASLEPPDFTYDPVEITVPARSRQVVSQTFAITLLVPRTVVGPGN